MTSGRALPSLGLDVPFELQVQGPLRALGSVAGSVVIRDSGFRVRWPGFKRSLCLFRCVSLGKLFNLLPCSALENGPVIAMMRTMMVMSSHWAAVPGPEQGMGCVYYFYLLG